MLMLIRMITVPMDDSAGCYSTISYTNNVLYYSVRGMVIGSQKASTDAFAACRYPSRSINGPYRWCVYNLWPPT